MATSQASPPLPSILRTTTTQYQFAVRSPQEYYRVQDSLPKFPYFQKSKSDKISCWLLPINAVAAAAAPDYKVDSQCQTLPGTAPGEASFPSLPFPSFLPGHYLVFMIELSERQPGGRAGYTGLHWATLTFPRHTEGLSGQVSSGVTRPGQNCQAEQARPGFVM